MKRLNLSVLMIILLLPPAGSHALQTGSGSTGLHDPVTKDEIRGIIEFLGSDLLEGRAPGTRGGRLAEEYVRSLFQMMGIEPYRGEYYQDFKLNGFSTGILSAEAGGVRLAYLDDIVGSYVREESEFDLKGGVVFAGFGIESDSWSWDDYKDVSVEGKVVLVRVNDPDPFEGDDLTYYGRWTYKIEEAARRGAKAILLIHTTDSAGYGWHVVRNSWGGEELYLDQHLDNDLIFRGWIREEKLIEILAAVKRSGHSLEELYAASESRDFRPVDLGFDIDISGSNSFRSFDTRNVVGYIRGSDPELSERAVLLSAHIDHLGRDLSIEDDGIYNGAIDNGSAVAAMMITARHLKAREKSLKYSVIILACQAEESGLLGSLYFAGTLDPDKIVANINYESTPVWERSRDCFGLGAKYSTLEDILKKVLTEEGLEYSYFSMSDRGFFYRSDQFSFARKGIPSIWLSAGEDFESGRNRIREFFDGDYHTVRDEYDPGWSLESTMQTIGVALRLVEYINTETPKIEWKGRMTFPMDD